MPPGNSHAAPLLNIDTRRHLLLVACTIDRLELITRCQRPAPEAGLIGQLATQPWLETISSLAGRWLPRKFRVLHWAWQAWEHMQRGR